MRKWLSLGAVLGAAAFAVLGAIGWPPQSLVATPLTDPQTHIVARALGGCVLGLVVATIGVVLWDTIVLPASLLRQTTVPLAKAALGLGLMFLAMALVAVPQDLSYAVLGTQSTVAKKVDLLLGTMASLLGALGPILCLEIAPKARSSGILLSAIALKVGALVVWANPSINEVRVTNFHIKLAGILTLAAVPLFLLFFLRLARTLERPDLEKLVGSAIKQLACWVGARAAAKAADWLLAARPLFTQTHWSIVRLIANLVAVMAMLGILFACFDLFRQMRALQREITQRL
jgi:hypothetical protein